MYLDQNLSDQAGIVLSGTVEPVTYTDFILDYEDFECNVDENLPQSSQDLQRLKKWVRQSFKKMRTAVNTELLSKIVKECSDNVKKLDHINFDKFSINVVENALPSFTEVQDKIKELYKALEDCNVHRSEIAHYINLMRTASSHITSYRQAVKAVVMDDEVCNVALVHVAERKRFCEKYLGDFQIIETSLKLKITTLSGLIDEDIKKRTNTLMRIESSIRLLTGYIHNDTTLLRGQSANKTSVPGTENYGNAGIQVEQL